MSIDIEMVEICQWQRIIGAMGFICRPSLIAPCNFLGFYFDIYETPCYWFVRPNWFRSS